MSRINEEDFKEHNFVNMGLRVGEKGIKLTQIGILDENNKIIGERLFDFKKNINIVGGVFKGAVFSERHAKGLAGAIYLRYWDNQTELIEWKSLEKEAEQEFAFLKLKGKASQIDEIEQALLPLRKVYQSLYKRYDNASIRALEAATLQALRTPVRSREK